MTSTPPKAESPLRLALHPRGLALMWYRVLRVAYLGFGFGGSYVLAAAIAFYSLVCLGPLGILMAASLQAYFGEGSASHEWLQVMARDLAGSNAGQIMDQVNTLLANPGSHVAGVVSVLVLMWAGLRLFETVERSLTEVWPGRLLRGFFGRKFISLLMMLVAGALLASFLLVEIFLATARGWLQHFPQLDVAVLEMLRPRFLFFVQFVLSVVAYLLVYKFIPVQVVPTRAAMQGALCAAVIWHAATPLFTYFISGSQQYNSMYGGLTGVVVFSLWALLGAQVLMFGAHYAAAYDHVFVKRRPRQSDDTLIGWPGRPRHGLVED